MLSRDSHACVRLEPRGFKIDADGFVDVVEGTRDLSAVRGPVTQSLDISLGEAHTSLEYRLEQLRADHARKLSIALSNTPASPLPPNFAPDLGLELVSQGWGDRQIAFPGVPVSKLRSLPGGGLSFSVRTSSDAEARTATFDFKGVHRTALLAKIGHAIPEMAEILSSANIPLRIDLPRPVVLTLSAVLGELQRTEHERFVPLIVIGIE